MQNEPDKATFLDKKSDFQDDPNAASRKQDHIELAFRSQITSNQLDNRFFYEPLFAAHPSIESIPATSFGKKQMKVPIWVSSMTGGTAWAKTINFNLARACQEFGMGMGLGSCRGLLFDDQYFEDFNVRPIIGDHLPLFANLGIAQLEQLIANNQTHKAVAMVEKLRADGLIIHINPMQEWLQPEGDRYTLSPLATIETILNLHPDLPIIVKEVGQGMGYHSLKTLFQLPLVAIDFAANGGTNFAKLELLRNTESVQHNFESLAFIGHSAEEMVMFSNQILQELTPDQVKCKQVIISGGVRDFLDGYYLINRLNTNAVYGQASGFLKYARGEYETLQNHVKLQIEGLAVANAYLKVR